MLSKDEVKNEVTKVSAKNRVIIRIWQHTYSASAEPRTNPLSQLFTHKQGHIGHISIELDDKSYISLLP